MSSDMREPIEIKNENFATIPSLAKSAGVRYIMLLPQHVQTYVYLISLLRQ